MLKGMSMEVSIRTTPDHLPMEVLEPRILTVNKIARLEMEVKLIRRGIVTNGDVLRQQGRPGLSYAMNYFMSEYLKDALVFEIPCLGLLSNYTLSLNSVSL